jgi:hypothetical protein
MNLGQVVTTISGLTLSNVNITSGNVTITNAIITGGTISNTTLTNVTLANVTISSVSTPITVAQGGTNVSTITANAVVIGNGTSSVTSVSPGTAGNVLTSNGTNWISQTGGAVTNISSGTSNVAIVSANGNVTSYVNGVLQSTLFSGGLSLTGSLNSTNTFGFKNRIINGSMVIDQRNSGASVTLGSGNTYLVDRFAIYATQASKLSAQRNAGAVTPPIGFVNYLGATSLSAYSVLSTDTFWLYQKIEGANIADFGWGTANAKTVTVSFWVYSSLTGTFSGSLENGSANRSYPFNYIVSSANTWTQISVTVAGDTTGTWATDNTAGLAVNFNLGSGSNYLGTAGAWASSDLHGATGSVNIVGTNTATFYITGVQLEVGTNATNFDFRPYGTEFALCQRYYQNIGSNFSGNTEGTTLYSFQLPFWQTMRVAPTCTARTGFYFNARYSGGDVTILNPTFTAGNTDSDGLWGYVTSSGLTANYPIVGRHQNYTG